MAFEDLLENADQIDQGNDQFAFGAFVVVEGFVGLGPDVFFDLLFLVEELRGVFEFFVFERRWTSSSRGSADCSSAEASGSGGKSILDLM